MKAKLLIIKILAVCLLLVTSQAFSEVKDVDNQEIISLMQSGVPIIDIRRPSEWSDTGVIAGSNLLTFFDEKGNYDAKKWLAKFKKSAKKGDPVIIICRSGRRSGIVAKFLDEQANYANVYNASGGIISWINSKNETVDP